MPSSGSLAIAAMVPPLAPYPALLWLTGCVQEQGWMQAPMWGCMGEPIHGLWHRRRGCGCPRAQGGSGMGTGAVMAEPITLWSRGLIGARADGDSGDSQREVFPHWGCVHGCIPGQAVGMLLEWCPQGNSPGAGCTVKALRESRHCAAPETAY